MTTNYFKAGIYSLLVLLLSACNSTPTAPYQNPDLPVNERVNDLISRMTLEEKVGQLVYDAPAIERLGVPAYNWWNECLHGVGRAGLATVFPQAIGMAAMFDKEQMYTNAVIISDEARAKHHEAIRNNEHGIYQGLTFWTPNINLFRDPRWGRGMETYGEDPFLTGELAVPFIKGLQGNDQKYLKLVATSKHFIVHSGPEYSRHTYDARIGKRDFFESYAPHFKRTVQEANVASVMCAYNRFEGEPCCGNGYLLNELLRNDWGFKGYVVSDCWALVDFYANHKVSDSEVDASATALKSGTDLNCGSVYPSLITAVDSGLVSEALLNQALTRLFTARFKLGMFDPAANVPFSQIPYQTVNSDAHKQAALVSAQKSMVLLKNQNNLLPLDKNLKTIAVIGPNANDEDVLLGNYNGFPEKAITLLQGIKAMVSSETEVLDAQGCDIAPNMPTLVPVPAANLYTDSALSTPGIQAAFYANTDFSGEPVAKQTHAQINFNWQGNAPIPELPVDNFSIRWSGYLTVQQSGMYYLGGDGKDVYKISLNGKLLADFDSYHHNQRHYSKVYLEKGTAYALQIDYTNLVRSAIMKLIWGKTNPDYENEALAMAKKSDVIIACMGLSPLLEGEEMNVNVEGFKGGDRVTLNLPKNQTELLKKLKATGKPIVLVLLNGSALAINWEAANIPAILEAWYPGQAAGTAVAQVLFGDYNPAGRLPVTFYKSEKQLPDFENYDMQGRTYRFFTQEPLFPFGYGLSYAKFTYTHLQLPDSGLFSDSLFVKIEVSNQSQMAGDEVVQLYVKDMEASVPVPLVALKGIQRIHLLPGETKTVTFKLTPDMFLVFDDDGCSSNEPGQFEITVGGQQPYTTINASSTQVVSKRIVLQ